jgi:Zn-dependent protease with chaperone function
VNIPSKKVFFLVVLVFLISINSLYSQDNFYHPTNIDSLFNHLDKSTDYQITRLNNKFLSKKKKILAKRLKILKKQVEDSTFIFIPEIDTQLKRVINVIYQANPELKQYNFHFLIDKAIIPNAAAYGDGNFVINLGLFDFVDSDDELAFIICHEIAHFLKNDVNSSIDKYVETINSKETKSKIKKIKQKRFGQTRAGLEFLKELSFDMFDYTRKKEITADIIGFQLFSNTPYNKYTAIIGLRKLGKLENIVFSDSINLSSHFNFENFPFNSSWIKKRQSLFDSDEEINDYKFNKDSLRSHPHTKERIKALLSKYKIDTLHINVSSEAISKLKLVSDQTLIKSLFDFKKYDLILYYAFRNIQKNNATEKDYTNIATTLQLIYDLKKKHLIGQYVAHTSPFSEEKYLNSIRLFIHNTDLRDIKNINLLFIEKHKDRINTEIYNQIYKYFKP